MLRFIWTTIFFTCAVAFANATEKIILTKDQKSILIGKAIYFIEDKSKNLDFNEIIHADAFTPLNKDIANFQTSESSFWLRFTIVNKDNQDNNYLEIQQPILDEVDLYSCDSEGRYHSEQTGMRFPFQQRKIKKGTNFVFKLDLKPGQEKTYYMKVRGKQQILIPLRIISEDSLDSDNTSRNLWFGIYCGIILVMFLYNIFVYLSIRDRSYIYYVLHTLFVGLTQGSLTGFTFKYLWPNSIWFGNYAVFLFTCLVSIVGIQFLIEFMRVRENYRKILMVLKIFQAIYIVYIFTSMAGFYSYTFGAILPTQSTIALIIFGVSIYFYRKGFSEAKFYLIGWSSLLLGIIIYVLKDFGLLPYNNFTAYSLLFGSAAEVTLLSFALADKINIFKAEKEKSQEETL